MKNSTIIPVLILAFTLLNGILIGQESYETAIRKHLETYYKQLGLQDSDIADWEITDSHVSSASGIKYVHIAQNYQGIRVMNGVANLALNAEGSVVHIGDRLVRNLATRSNKKMTPSWQPKDAVIKAAEYLEMKGAMGDLIQQDDNGFRYGKGSLSREDIGVDLRWWDNGEEVQLVWMVSLYEKNGDHWWQVFVDAHTGEDVNRLDWVTHCAFHEPDVVASEICQPEALMAPPPQSGTEQYNVFALPIESPSHGSRTIEVDPSNSTASPFGWHDDNGVAGEEYTITRGNNVYAYEDTQNNDAPGTSPDGGSALNFDFPLNLNLAPSSYLDAGITNLFYTCNMVHDILYGYGFDESSGNFQSNNYGNGGFGGDEVMAEGQDGGGTNNANFATPPEGQNPTMQMFLWSGNSISNLLTVNSPGSVAGGYTATGAAYGPGVPTTPIIADLVLVDDATQNVNDGCEPVNNTADVNGKIAVIYRGDCNFTVKVKHAQDAGAVAVIIVNNVATAIFTMGGTDPTITIPSVMISSVDGGNIISAMSSGTVNATIVDNSGSFEVDSDFDNGIVIHEYGHGVSTRLTGGGSNTNCLFNAEQMGEGWSDFLACILTMDTSVANPVYRPIGTYAIAESTTGIGIRNAPYDTSFAVNNYTYDDVADDANISQPHGIGFVWATMLWDLNWALIDQYGYDADIESGTGGNNIALQLVMEGLKLQPCEPGFVDGRDAILQADQLIYGGANECLIWKVFARRGLGYSASQGSSDSRYDQVAAFDIPGNCQIPTTAPTANFDANVYATCSGEITFDDMSVNVAQGWQWDFGDGSTDTVPNPTHIYSSPGTYTVALTVTNSIGSDVIVKTNFIEVTQPNPPIAADANGCINESVLLTASGSNTIYWWDQFGNMLGTGNTFSTPPLTTSGSYLVQDVIEHPTQNVGPVDQTFGTGGNHNTGFIGAINLDAQAELTIRSAWVFSGSSGIRTVRLWDGYNSTGNVIQTVNVDVPFTGAGRVDLNLEIPGPGQYSFGLDGADLYRNNSGANYPYEIPGLISLVSSSATTDPSGYYYYFYDLEVQEKPCSSEPTEVTVNVVDEPVFNWTTNDLTANFIDATPGASAWQWDFGDGNSSTLQNPSHTYTQEGTYEVSLAVNGACAAFDTIEVKKGILLSVFEEEKLRLSLYPNPTRNETRLVLNAQLAQNAQVDIYGMDGRLIKSMFMQKGEDQLLIHLGDVAPQVYYIMLHHDNLQIRKQLLIK